MDTGYVIRSYTSATPAMVTVTFVDMRGHVDAVTVRRNVTTLDQLDPIIRAVIQSRYDRHPPSGVTLNG